MFRVARIELLLVARIELLLVARIELLLVGLLRGMTDSLFLGNRPRQRRGGALCRQSA